jgi:hypothetical protein
VKYFALFVMKNGQQKELLRALGLVSLLSGTDGMQFLRYKLSNWQRR